MATRYSSNLGNGQRIDLENWGRDNRDTQTIVTLSSSTLSSTGGQQQSQQTTLNTGAWVMPPSLFRSPTGIIVRLETEQGQTFLQIQSNQIQVLSHPPTLSTAEVLPIEATQDTGEAATPPMQPMQPMQPIAPMQPMQPMQPMKMGNMEMQMNPMQMRMGDMEMHMGTVSKEAQSTTASTPKFCSQCGHAVSSDDRFCSQCGHSLKI